MAQLEEAKVEDHRSLVSYPKIYKISRQEVSSSQMRILPLEVSHGQFISDILEVLAWAL